MATQEQSAEDMFEQALALDPGEQAAFLDRACSGSAELRAMVEELLARDAAAGSFLKHPLFGVRTSEDSAEDATTRAAGGLFDDGPHPVRAQSDQFGAGDVLSGRFRVVRFIANGGMGEVYEVEDGELQGDRLALKTVLPQVAEKADMQARFEREVLLARRVVHPNLCPIYDIFHCRHNGAAVTFLTMKLLSGETLAARIKARGPLRLAEATPIVLQVADALTAAHEAGILHRDIKAANVMLGDSSGHVHACVMDFGLARAYRSESTVLTVDGVAGTPGYVAPELFHGAEPSTASDVYAFGVMVYNMLTGHLPPVRLSSKSKAARDPLIDKLPANWRAMIDGCLQPDVGARYQTIPEAIAAIRPGGRSSQRLVSMAMHMSRRRMIGLGAAAGAAAAGGVWVNLSRIDFLFEPLPEKRFVALLGWPPPSDAKIAPMVTAAVDAIGSELVRAEAFDHNLLIIPHSVSKDMTSLAKVNELRESLGANLVLAVSGTPVAKEVQLLLRVLDPAAARTLRQSPVRIPLREQPSLPQKVVHAAAKLLNIRGYQSEQQRARPETNSPEAYISFQKATALMKQENDSGLDEAIDAYKAAIDGDARYAAAYAGLAMAYCRFAAIHHDSGALGLARADSEKALSYDSSSIAAHMALASVLEQTGDETKALNEMKVALGVDPSNCLTLIWQAEIYARLNKWPEAKEAFDRTINQRPNNWLAHNELGALLNDEGKYSAALHEFEVAHRAAPKNTLPLNNMGSIYLQLGSIENALLYSKESFDLKANGLAAGTMAAALRIQGKLQEAREFAHQATQLDPDDSTTWLELGDCCSLIPKKQKEAAEAYTEAQRVQAAELDTDPNDGPGLMLLALYRVKVGLQAGAKSMIQEAETKPAGDMDSQLYKARTLELLGERATALETVAKCLSRGARRCQIESMPDMRHFIADARYQVLRDGLERGV